MKAIVFHEFGGTEKLVYEDVSEPDISADEVLVRIKAASVNHLDIWIRQGIPAYKTLLPHISGADGSGVVEAVGSGIEDIKPGDRVIIAPGISCFKCNNCLSGNDNLCDSYTIMGTGVDGTYAEYAKTRRINLIPIPENLSFEEAAAFPLTFLTAWHMLVTRAGIKPGDDLLVLGAGSGIGVAAIQIGRVIGARVIASAGSDDKLKKAKDLGADEVINYTKEDFSKKVREITGGRGVDLVFEHIGPDTWEKSIASLAKNGRLVTCGSTSGPEVKLDLRYIFSRQLSIFGSMMGTRSELLHVTKLISMGKLRPVIDSIHPLKEAGKVQELMLERKNFGKYILVP